MDIAQLIEEYSTSMVAAVVAVACLLSLLLVRLPALRRSLFVCLGAMAVFFLIRLTRLTLTTEMPQVDGYLKVISQLVFAYGVLRPLMTFVFDVRPLRRRGAPTPRIVRQVVFGVVFAAIALAILRSTLKIDLASVIATSAVLSLVLGLALQDTLGNLFAGLSLQAEKPFEVGDWVTFGSFEGRITQVGWRSTWIQDRQDDLVSVPNNVIAREALVNHSRPERVSGMVMEMGLSYDAPPNQAKAALMEVLRAHPDVVDHPAPTLRQVAYADSSITYHLRFWVREYDRRWAVRDEVYNAIWYRMKRAGFEIPFPMRTVHLHPRDPEYFAREEAAHLEKVEEYLDGSDLLAPLTAEQRRKLALSGRRLAYGVGEVVFREGDAGESAFVLMQGRLTTERGDGRPIGSIAPGEIFGEAALLTGQPRTATARAATDVELLEIDREGFGQVLMANERIAREIADILERRRAARAALPGGQAEPSSDAVGDPSGLLGRIRDIFGLKR